MRNYELMVCLRPDLAEEAVMNYPARLTEIINAQGGTVIKDTSMGRRRLAYPIRKLHEGFYHVINFQLDAPKVAPLDFQLRVNEDILRHIIVHEGE
ncbi:MAG: 30S ribosomal protein S6 [Chloroflexi bacterium]|nr:30S ribosomal protein S6 [Chloroflexota bacterium]